MSQIQKETLQLLQEFKTQLFAVDSIQILGVFGSIARGQADVHSDLDLLYTQNGFFEKYQGLKALNRLEEIREEMEMALHRSVDLIYREGLPQEMSESVYENFVSL